MTGRRKNGFALEKLHMSRRRIFRPNLNVRWMPSSSALSKAGSRGQHLQNAFQLLKKCLQQFEQLKLKLFFKNNSYITEVNSDTCYLWKWWRGKNRRSVALFPFWWQAKVAYPMVMCLCCLSNSSRWEELSIHNINRWAINTINSDHVTLFNPLKEEWNV